jgi:hypothetical protein
LKFCVFPAEILFEFGVPGVQVVFAVPVAFTVRAEGETPNALAPGEPAVFCATNRTAAESPVLRIVSPGVWFAVKVSTARAAGLTADTAREEFALRLAPPTLHDGSPVEGVALIKTLMFLLDGVLGGVTVHA